MSTVLFLGFDEKNIKELLQTPNKIKKVVIFDKSDENREIFEKLYIDHMCYLPPSHPEPQDRTQLTMYEGCIQRNLESFLQKTANDGLEYVYSGDITLLNSCKSDKVDDLHESCK